MAARVAVVFALCLASGVHAGSKPVAINRDVAVTKTLTADTLSAAALNVTGSVSVGKDVTATRVKAALLTADVLETGTLSPKAGDTIIIEGDLELASASSSSSAVSFLEAQTSNGVWCTMMLFLGGKRKDGMCTRHPHAGPRTFFSVVTATKLPLRRVPRKSSPDFPSIQKFV